MARNATLTRRRLLMAGGALALGAALWWGGPPVLRSIGFFRVRRVEVVGARWLPAETIVTALRLRPSASVADPVDSLESRVFAVIGVGAVNVARRFPGTLVVSIEEREPVAYAPVDGVLAPVDARGKVLPYDARRGAASLPVLAAPDAKAARLLAQLRRSEPVLFAAVSSGWTEGDDVVLATERGRLRFDARTKAEAMRAVRLVGERLTAEGRPWGELDGRFAGMVIRRGTGA